MSSKSNRAIKRKKLPAKASLVSSSCSLKFLDSILCHQPQLGRIIRAKPCAVAQHPATSPEDTVIPSKPGKFFELIDQSRQRLDPIHHELDDTFYLIFVFLEEHFDLNELIQNDSNPKLMKKGEIAPIELTAVDLKKKLEQNNPPLSVTTIKNLENLCFFKLEDVFPNSQVFP